MTKHPILTLVSPTDFDLNCAFARLVVAPDRPDLMQRLEEAVRAAGPNGSIGWLFVEHVERTLPYLEALKLEGYWVHIKDHTNGILSDRRDWLVMISNYDDCCDVDLLVKKPVYVEGSAPSLGRAIVIAILRVKGVRIDE